MKAYFKALYRAFALLPDAIAASLEKFTYDARAYRDSDGAYWSGYYDGIEEVRKIKEQSQIK